MAENCWQFGFILRYPDGKTDVTGIIYEPWHFRYVGLELAQELNQLGLTMEEYMDMLTERAAAK
jgi:D-alanyl-D-alanine carboxypeptidase